MAIAQGLQDEKIGILAIGNAPIALPAAMESLQEINPEKWPLIIGGPVGFVNAAESKVLPAARDFPHITSMSRRINKSKGKRPMNITLHVF